jgi:hypothetical protein
MNRSRDKADRGSFIFSHTLRIVFGLLLIIAVWKRDWVYAVACVMSILISFLPAILKRDYNITLPWVLDLLIASALFLHIGGGVLNAYYTIPGFDHITHFVSSALVSFLAFTVIYILDEYWDGLHMDIYAMAFVVVIFAMAMGVVWEFLEWALDLFFGTHEQWGLQDTMRDLLVDTIGGIIMAVVGVKLAKSGKLKELLGDLGNQVYNSIIRRDNS